MGAGERSPVGRVEELTAIRSFLARRGPGALVLSGGAGVGKTTLWEAGAELAGRSGHRVLATRARDAETGLSFVGLGDLLDGLPETLFAELAAPQRQALDVALLRAEPTGAGADPRAIGVGLLGVLRRLAADGPVLICVDDIQWLDPPTADALAFALGRASGLPVALLASKRSGTSSQMPYPDEVVEVEVEGLGAEELAELLSARLDLRLDAATLRELERVSHGNALFALEVGRRLVRDGVPHAGQPLPHPGGVEDLVGSRVAELPADVRRVLLASALGDETDAACLGDLVSEDAVHAALTQGLVADQGTSLRPAHPLLGAAAVAAASPAERRALHAELARIAPSPDRRAHHRALSLSGPDDGVAAEIAAAGQQLAARGALVDAVVLAEHALRLTREDAPTRPDRVLELGDLLARVGHAARVDALLDVELERLPKGAPRARGYLLRCDGLDADTLERYEQHLEMALAEDIDDATVWALALSRRVALVVVNSVERLDVADDWSREALRAARGAGELAAMEARQARAWVLALRGRPPASPSERADGVTVSDAFRSVARVEARRLTWRGELREARRLLVDLYEAAEDQGEDLSLVVTLVHLLELELRAGAVAAAERTLELIDANGAGGIISLPLAARLRAQLAAFRGDRADSRGLAEDAITLAADAGIRWDELEARVAGGLAALAAGDPLAAIAMLEPAWRHTRDEGVDEVGAFPSAPELAEAYVAVERVDDARAILAALQPLVEAQDHPWGRATVDRIRGLVAVADGDVDAGCEALERAVEAYEARGLGHDEARTLLALGRIQRRRRKWGAARIALDRAAARFAADGAEGWAQIASEELERVGARRPASDPSALTPAEGRVAALAAAGRSNKEIAQALVVAVSTVEAHLSRVYAKLGVRSRGQLAARIGDEALAESEKVRGASPTDATRPSG